MKKLLLSEKEYSLIMFIVLFINILMERFVKEYVMYSEALCILVFIFILIATLKNKKLYSSDIGLCLLCLVIVTSVSTYIKNPDYVSSMIVPVIMIFYYLIPRKITCDDYLKKEKIIHSIIILTVLLLSMLSLINSDTMDNTGRLKGIFGHPNTLASYNLFAIFSIIQLISINKSKKTTWSLCLIPIIYTMYKTGSRTCILVTSIFVFLYFLYLVISYKRYSLKKISIVFGIFVLIGMLFIFLFKEQIFTFILRGKDISNMSLTTALNTITSNRFYMWTKEIPYMMDNNWLIGNGINGFIDIAFEKRMYDSLIMDDWISSTHNFIFEIIFISGIVGFLIFIWSVITITKECYLRYKELPYTNNVKNIVDLKMLVIICMFVYFFFEVDFLWLGVLSNLYFYLNIGFVINILFSSKKEAKNEN